MWGEKHRGAGLGPLGDLQPLNFKRRLTTKITFPSNPVFCFFFASLSLLFFH
jgi:hypothetical protein